MAISTRPTVRTSLADAIADSAPHHRLRQIAQRAGWIPHAVQETNRVADPVLHDPLHLDDVEIARQHQRFARKIVVRKARALKLSGILGAETEFLLEYALGGHELHPVDAEGQLEVQSRIGNTDHAAEALDDGPLLRLYRIKRAECGPGDNRDANEDRECGGLPTDRATHPGAATTPARTARTAGGIDKLFDNISCLTHDFFRGIFSPKMLGVPTVAVAATSRWIAVLAAKMSNR